MFIILPNGKRRERKKIHLLESLEGRKLSRTIQLQKKHCSVYHISFFQSLPYCVRGNWWTQLDSRIKLLCVCRRCTTTRTCPPPQWSSYSRTRRGPPSSAPSTAYSTDPRLRQPPYIITLFNSCLLSCIFLYIVLQIRDSVADPGSSTFLTPGFGMDKNPDPE